MIPPTARAAGFFGNSALSYVLTDQQEALLGCGSYWQTNCDNDGMDLLNAELSVMIQSWAGFPGTTGLWNSAAGPAGPIQPGTIRNCGANPGAPGCNGSTGLVPFDGGAVASRLEGGVRYTHPRRALAVRAGRLAAHGTGSLRRVGRRLRELSARPPGLRWRRTGTRPALQHRCRLDHRRW